MVRDPRKALIKIPLSVSNLGEKSERLLSHTLLWTYGATVARPAHNGLVVGSSPARSTNIHQL